MLVAPIVRRHAGAFLGYIATSPEKEQATRDGLLEQFAQLCAEPVTERELTQAKTFALGSHAIRREAAANVMADLADAWLYGESLDEIDEYEARIRAVTADHILAVAKSSFDANRRVEGVIRGVPRAV